LKLSIEVEENGGGGDFNADINTVLNDDLYAATTDIITASATNVANDTITIVSDGTNTASVPTITATDSQIRLKAGQTSIQDASGNTALTG